MKIAMAQENPTVGDVEGNLALALDATRRAAARGADLCVLSELFLTGYPPKDLVEREGFVAAQRRALDRFAAEAPIPAVIGFVDADPARAVGRRIYNAAAAVDGGAVVSVHRKALLPTYDVFDEARHFEPASVEDLRTVRLRGRTLGVTICEDAWNDPDFWPRRLYPLDPVGWCVAAGAEIVLNLSASPFTLEKRSLRPRMLAAAARHHGRPLVYVNQVGGNDELLFDGHSLAFAADGALLARGAEFASDLVLLDPDAGAGEVRPTAPGDLDAALDGLVLGTRDYARKCGFRKVAVGLSGGVDSSLVAAIATRALGPENVLGVSMPSRFSSDGSRTDAAALARNLGIELLTISIEPPFEGFLRTLAPVVLDRPPEAAGTLMEENLQARARGAILMALSNRLGLLVLTTGNKSELAVGYCTLYGDMCGGLAVIADVPKTMVYDLCGVVNRARELIPRSVLTKPPSAELRPNQTDQDTLPPYALLDRVLKAHVEEGLDAAQIVAAGLPAPVVHDVLAKVRAAEYKRRQAAPGLKLTSKAFGSGRRLPIAARYEP